MAAKSQEIQQFITEHIEQHPRDIVRVTMECFGLTRQAVNRHVKTLIEDEVIEAKGKTSERTYALVEKKYHFELPLNQNQEEDVVYRELLAPLFENFRENIQRICHYGFTEMFNNAIDHSGGTKAEVYLAISARNCSIVIIDNGIGIFEKIRTSLGLHDTRMAVLELSKGKLTTAPDRHSGQGIFFHGTHVR